MDDYETKSNRMQLLTRANYQSWMAMVRDYIYAIDHDDAHILWDNFVWVRQNAEEPDPIAHDFQAATTAPTRRLRVLHNKAWAFIRRNLS